MAAGMPTPKIVEIEFVAGTWTDVSADVEWPDTLAITSRGRTSPYGTTQSATLTFTLNNLLGKYMSQRQVLADGVTANPYYPNVMQRKRVRYSYVSGGTTYIRFVGYIQAWTPAMVGNVLGHVLVTAVDRFGSPLTRFTLNSPIAQETGADNPSAQWRLTDPAGTTAALDSLGNNGYLSVAGSGAALTFGSNGPGYGDGTGVLFAPTAASAGQYLQSGPVGILINGRSFTIETWVNAGTTLPSWATGAGFENILGVLESGNNFALFQLALVGGKPSYADAGSTLTAPASIADGGWHHLAISRTGNGTGVTLYVDGVSVGTTLSSFSTVGSSAGSIIAVGELPLPSQFPVAAQARFSGNIGYVGIYGSTVLSAARIAAHATATQGYRGDTTDARIQRWCLNAGLTLADLNLDAGSTTVGSYAQAGAKVPQACQDMAITEGGGAAVYVATDGRIRFANRHFRTSATVALTLDAVKDLDGNAFSGSQDDMTLVNQSTANRSTMSGTQTTQVATDAASVTLNGISNDGGFATYTTSDADALGSAQWRVASNRTPGYRLSQVSVDLASAETNLYAPLASVQIGSRIRGTSLPAAVSPVSQLDVICEGWSETVDASSYKIVFDTSPADDPAFGIYGPSTYGLYQADPGTTLNALISPSATTLAIATTGTTFTTVAGSYPFNIQIGQEIITLTSAPSGSTSPQTFTGVTRGVNGTPNAQQSAGSAVSVWPLATYGF